MHHTARYHEWLCAVPRVPNRPNGTLNNTCNSLQPCRAMCLEAIIQAQKGYRADAGQVCGAPACDDGMIPYSLKIMKGRWMVLVKGTKGREGEL